MTTQVFYLDNKAYTGAEAGQEMADNIRYALEDGDNVKLVIGQKVCSVNSSYLEAVIKPTMVKYGKEKLQNLITFFCLGRYSITADLDESIDRIERDVN